MSLPRRSSSPDAKLKFVLLVLAALSALYAPRIIQAQVLYGSLTGNVVDQTGAVVKGAKVEALNSSTGTTKSAVTDDRGVYLLNNLEIGITN